MNDFFEIESTDDDTTTLTYDTGWELWSQAEGCFEVFDIEDDTDYDPYVFAQTVIDAVDAVLVKNDIHEAQINVGIQRIFIDIEVDYVNAEKALEVLNKTDMISLINEATITMCKVNEYE